MTLSPPQLLLSTPWSVWISLSENVYSRKPSESVMYDRDELDPVMLVTAALSTIWGSKNDETSKYAHFLIFFAPLPVGASNECLLFR
jgi:hypothetical protein